MSRDYIKLNQGIKRCIIKYRNTKNDSWLTAIKNLWSKRSLIQSGNYIVRDMSSKVIQVYGGCVPFHYIPGIKDQGKLFLKLNSGLNQLRDKLINDCAG